MSYAVVYRRKPAGKWRAAQPICETRGEAEKLAKDETQFAFSMYETAVAYIGDPADWKIVK